MGKTYVYTYTNGNISSRKEYAYTISETLGTAVKTDTWTYGDSDWGDLLTAYNGTSTAVNNGRITALGGKSLTYSYLGLLATAETTSYSYDTSGRRFSKTTGSTTTSYYYAGDMLVGEKTGNNKIEFLYDLNGEYYGFEYNDTPYYYFKNLQGDVIAIGEDYNTIVATYEYDAWGRLISSTDTSGINIGTINPIRYRSYYYDTETGFYYLKTRYYSPEICRFLSPDGAIAEVGGDVLGYNQFAYCFNNPVNLSDSNGNWPKIVTEVANRVKYALSMTFRIFTLPLKALEASVGVGVGIGGEISGSVGGIDMGASAKNTVTNSIIYKDYSFDVVNSTTENLSISLGKSSIGVTNGKSHSLLSDDCTCATHNYSYLQQPLCPANEIVQSSDSFFGVSGALYLGIGVEFSIGFNIDTLKNEMINIYNSEYESIYFW